MTKYDESAHPDLRATNALGMHRDLGGCEECRMTAYSASNPLPMRFPATNPPVAGNFIDIVVWPGEWRFWSQSDRMRFDRLPEDDRAQLQSAFEAAAREIGN